jgi:hypothetical protein
MLKYRSFIHSRHAMHHRRSREVCHGLGVCWRVVMELLHWMSDIGMLGEKLINHGVKPKASGKFDNTRSSKNLNPLIIYITAFIIPS